MLDSEPVILWNMEYGIEYAMRAAQCEGCLKKQQLFASVASCFCTAMTVEVASQEAVLA